MSFKIVSFILLFTWTKTVFSELPPEITPCSSESSTEDYNQCVLQQLKILTPQLAKGIPLLKLPQLDPLNLSGLVIDRNLNDIKIKANFTNIRVYGASHYSIEELKANPKALAVFMVLHFPYIHIKGNCDIKGNYLLLPFNENGAFKGNFTNTQVRVSAEGKEIIDKNNIRRVELDKLVTKIRVGDGNIKFKTSRFQGARATAELAVAFFNSNPRLGLDIVNPIVEDTAATIGKALAARALGALTKDEILP
ncbi:uncharacterized protein [Chelonus insularis]|uniref:uncharacterized protein n=1 Tax=Chelonus insularis TaxID=460826 RepID=UPI00158A2525|nr:uncharacterized protein LOC118064473 [Chelonus insularis]